MTKGEIQIRNENVTEYVLAIVAAVVLLAVSCAVAYPFNVHIAWLPVVLFAIVLLLEGLYGLVGKYLLKELF